VKRLSLNKSYRLNQYIFFKGIFYEVAGFNVVIFNNIASVAYIGTLYSVCPYSLTVVH